MKDISLMTKEEFDRYGLNRMKIMLKMKKIHDRMVLFKGWQKPAIGVF